MRKEFFAVSDGLQKYLEKYGRGKIFPVRYTDLLNYRFRDAIKDKNGKLRLMYECNALAFLAEQAGGSATDGQKRILEIKPKDLHQRTPFYVGSKNMVEKAIRVNAFQP